MSNNPRDRNLVHIGAPSTQRAQLPSIPLVPTGIEPALQRFLQAVKERMEVREGSRGNPWEKTITKRDLREMGLEQLSIEINNSAGGTEQGGALLVKSAKGSTGITSIGVDQFVESLKRSRAFKDLMKRLDDPTRFDDYPGQIRDLLLSNIAEEAALRGADIQRLDEKIQTAEESLAYTVTEVTAAVGENAAGLRDLQFAYADSTSAQAGQITQIQASLGNYYQDGTPGKASLEQEMTVQTDAVKGLYSRYQVKVQAGGEFGGFSLSAYEDPNSEEDSISQFLIAADKFAVVTPDGKQFPFGVDANGVYIRGTTTIRDVNGNMVFLANGNIDYSKVEGLGALATLNEVGADRIKDPGNLVIDGKKLNTLKALAFRDTLTTTDITDIGQFVTTTVDGKVGALTPEKIAGLASYIEQRAVTVQALKGGTLFQGDGISGGNGIVFRLGLNTYVPAFGRSFWMGGGFYSPVGGGVYGESGELGVVGRGGLAGVMGMASNGNSGEVGSASAGVVATSNGSSPALWARGSFTWSPVSGYPQVTFAPPDGSSTKFMRADGQWAVPGGGSSGITQVNADYYGALPSSGQLNLYGDAVNMVGVTVKTHASGNTIYVRATGTSPSDVRLKEDIAPIPYGLAEVLKLRPVSYRLRADESRMLGYGLIAQEVEDVIPTGSSLVFDDPEAKTGDIEGHKVIHYQSYIPVLIKAVQELSAQVVALQDEVRTLRG